MKTVEENFEADKIQAAIDYLEYKGVLNKIKAQAIEEMINTISRDRNGMYDPEDIKQYTINMRGE